VKEIPSGTLVVRAHGLSPKIIAQAEEAGLVVVNTTCGFVMKAQHIAKTLHDEGYTVIITGEENHPEVKSICGMTDNTAHVCVEVDQVDHFENIDKMGVLSQTTFSESKFKEMVQILMAKDFGEIRVFNTLCQSIDKRSVAAQDIASKVDCMLVVGGKMSSNTKRLHEFCRDINPNSYHIETKEDTQTDWFKNATNIGISAGASTPQWIITDLEQYIQNL